MAGRWSDVERGWGPQDYGRRDERDRERWEGGEARAFGRRERVFGERESGMGYNQPRDIPGPEDDDRPDWQDRDYEGVSPAFRQHERDYDSGYRAYPRFQTQDYTRGRGGRFYGDDGRGQIFREDYGYGADPTYARGSRFGSREADARYAREMNRGEAFEDRAREAGEFFRRTGRRVANWFSDVAGEGAEMGRYEDRGARGLGPKGYKRSDERISEDIHERLTDDAWLDAREVSVAVLNGEVTLAGSVASREARRRAERIVEDVSGVTHVQNNLRANSDGPAAARTEGDASTETSANATHTTSRRN